VLCVSTLSLCAEPRRCSNITPYSLSFADSSSQIRARAPSTGKGLMAAENGKGQNENSIASFKSYTDTSRWRPQMFANTFDDYQHKVGNDVGSIFAFGFKNFKPSSDNFLANIIITALSPIIVIPLMMPFVALALPVIMIKHFSFALLPAMAFDIILKTFLTAAFVVQHPVSSLRVVIGGIGQMVHRKPGNSDSSES
jgi:hypothetical protein